MNEGQSINHISSYYQRVMALLKNDHLLYDSLYQPKQPKSKYLGQMYINDLTRDKLLKASITYFLENIDNPARLESFVEPTFIKKLLTIKRELIMQGIHFDTKK